MPYRTFTGGWLVGDAATVAAQAVGEFTAKISSLGLANSAFDESASGVGELWTLRFAHSVGAALTTIPQNGVSVLPLGPLAALAVGADGNAEAASRVLRSYGAAAIVLTPAQNLASSSTLEIVSEPPAPPTERPEFGLEPR